MSIQKLQNKVRQQLVEIVRLHKSVDAHLQPSRTGSGAVSQERSIGINVAALDFSMAKEMLLVFHSWESIIRMDRRLTPPALVPAEASTHLEVVSTVEFHLAHLDWSAEQDWFGDFANEVNDFYFKGVAANKEFSEQVRRIPCPTDDCDKMIVIDADDLMTEVTCRGCRQSWSAVRLIALAVSNPNKQFFLDVEAIAAWIGVTERAVYKIIKNHKIARRGNLYDLGAIIKTRS